MKFWLTNAFFFSSGVISETVRLGKNISELRRIVENIKFGGFQILEYSPI